MVGLGYGCGMIMFISGRSFSLVGEVFLRFTSLGMQTSGSYFFNYKKTLCVKFILLKVHTSTTTAVLVKARVCLRVYD